jgi:hypothetical protein
MVGDITNHKWSITGENRQCKVCGLVAHSLSDVLIKENEVECVPPHVEAYIVGIMDELTFLSIDNSYLTE